MKNAWKLSLVLAAALAGLSARSNAQSVETGVGSSAMFLQLGQAAYQLNGPGACAWTATSGVAAADSFGSGSTDTGQAFVIWKSPSGCTSGAVTSGSVVYAYLQTDSVVGDRCLFNATCTITNSNPSGLGTSGVLHSADSSITEVTTPLPTAILTLVTGRPTFAGTDIRPEDAEFAITRALTLCGTKITQFTGLAGHDTQYEGLGYDAATNNKIFGFSGVSFNVVPFSLSSFTVTTLSKTPIVVAVNTDGSGVDGFSNPKITKLTRSPLALYLDGAIGHTNDALAPGTTGGFNSLATIFVREPLSCILCHIVEL